MSPCASCAPVTERELHAHCYSCIPTTLTPPPPLSLSLFLSTGVAPSGWGASRSKRSCQVRRSLVWRERAIVHCSRRAAPHRHCRRHHHTISHLPMPTKRPTRRCVSDVIIHRRGVVQTSRSLQFCTILVNLAVTRTTAARTAEQPPRHPTRVTIRPTVPASPVHQSINRRCKGHSTTHQCPVLCAHTYPGRAERPTVSPPSYETTAWPTIPVLTKALQPGTPLAC